MASADPLVDPRNLLGLSLTADQLSHYLNELAERRSIGKSLVTPEVKAYPDALYMNYYVLGLSLMFISRDGSKIKGENANSDKLVLDSIDIYNILPSKESKAAVASPPSNVYQTHPVSELILSLAPPKDGKEPPKEIRLTPSTSGKDLVSELGEPDRKGGGGGPSKGSIDIWCEWTNDGIMVEFGGEEAKGPKAWETGKDAKWKVLTLFRTSGR